MKLKTKLMWFNAIIVAFAVIICTAVSLTSFRQTLLNQAKLSQESRMKTLHELLKHKGKDIKVAGDKMMAGDYVINDNFEVPDKVKEVCGGTATIFMGDTRISTNVIKKEGGRAVGTKLKGPAYDAVFKEGKAYRGEADILGTPYFTAYDPIKSTSGEVIGVLYVGVPKNEFFAPYYRIKYILISIALLMVVASAGLGSIVVKLSLKKLGKVCDVLREAATGNLAVRVDGEGKDEVGQLAHSVNRMLHDMNGTLQEVVTASHHLATSASQLYVTAEQMATGTEEVAAQTGTIATASEEMAATSSEIAENCSLAADGSGQASQAATSGAAVVSKTVLMMNRIAERVKESARTVETLGERSQQIGAIVGTIEDIADQTNLLALNAAIEAARAGEQGRGFAVVADEVRALAERTTKATREISEMIKAIQQQTKSAVAAMEEGEKEVEAGTSEASKSSDALSDILSQIDNVTTQVNQIATAAEQQTSTTGEISRNITQITDVINETAKGAQESATGASQLAQLAEELKKIVAHFKLAA